MSRPPRPPAKERTALADVDRDWLAASPFCLVTDPGLLDRMVVKGQRPVLAVVVGIEQ